MEDQSAALAGLDLTTRIDQLGSASLNLVEYVGSVHRLAGCVFDARIADSMTDQFRTFFGATLSVKQWSDIGVELLRSPGMREILAAANGNRPVEFAGRFFESFHEAAEFVAMRTLSQSLLLLDRVDMSLVFQPAGEKGDDAHQPKTISTRIPAAPSWREADVPLAEWLARIATASDFDHQRLLAELRGETRRAMELVKARVVPALPAIVPPIGKPPRIVVEVGETESVVVLNGTRHSMGKKVEAAAWLHAIVAANGAIVSKPDAKQNKAYGKYIGREPHVDRLFNQLPRDIQLLVKRVGTKGYRLLVE